MTLVAILSSINDNSDVIVYSNMEEVARYDGKNSIPEELNSENVIQIFAGDNYIGIDIE